MKEWIDFIPLPDGKMKCERCGKVIQAQRMARGAHAAKCLQVKEVSEEEDRKRHPWPQKRIQ